MANESLLLNFVVPTTIRDVLPSADLSWLKNVIVIALPKSGATAGIYDCTTKAEIQAQTDAIAYELLDSGMSSVTLCTAATLTAAKVLLDADTTHRYLTVLVDPAFASLTDALAWTRDYVLGWQTTDKALAKTAAAGKDVSAFYDAEDDYGILMYRSFGQFLSQSTWKNLQLTRLDDSDAFGISDLGVANELFDAKVSFAITDPEYKTCLALFAAGGATITAPYILKQTKIQTQSLFVQYLSLRNPAYTVREAGLIESYLSNNLNQLLVQTNDVEKLLINVDLDDSLDDWYVSGVLQVRKPRAIWRMNLTFYQDILGGTNA